MASTACIWQRKLGQRSDLLEDFAAKRSALESGPRSTDEGRRRQAAVMGRYGASQPMRRLKVEGEHKAILVE
jgi:hypothetical protein